MDSTLVLSQEMFGYNNVVDGALAERLRRGLQNLVDEFDSRTCLHDIPGFVWEFALVKHHKHIGAVLC